MKKIVIFSSSTETGGTECLHQLCDLLRSNNFDAAMHYNLNSTIDVVLDQYKKYNIEVLKKFTDDPNQIVVLPDIFCEHMFMFKHSQVFIWWLSVDNYLKYSFSKMSILNKFKHITKSLLNSSINYRFNFSNLKSNVKHLCQSQYAKEFLILNSVSENKLYFLNDYINEVYTNQSEKNYVTKKDIVLYNPKKGIDFTQKIISENPKLNFVPLINYSRKELYELFRSAKVYIDFGNHPGRDKIPREACALDCIVFVGLSGSAVNDIDVPIKQKYKVNFNNFNPKQIGNEINLAFSDYSNQINDFNDYKKVILKGKDIFVKQALNIFN